jgi:dTDP-4-dehydrorhamnose 3,5-epimerase
MKFIETRLKGAFIIELELLEDERGFFSRTFCRKEFEAHGLNSNLVQCNISFNKKKGTLRGMHYQVAPYEEAKLVSCIRGVIYDAIIDLRKDSPTYCQWFAVELSAESYKMLYVPEGFAHGFQTSAFYSPECARGVRWDDPALGVRWPLAHPVISKKDINYADFRR